ncbi:MAG: hypothetical protein HY560_13500 [Gemmatimonadetes bacterium]|nr:hypothetical protein [Gemmatimonadota bacterium]
MRLIDLRAILRRTVSDEYGDLVTRRTGAAVRGGVERALAELDQREPAVIDFSAVRCLDLSCADEIVAKLVLQYGSGRFIFRGLSPAQREALESVLEHHGLAVVTDDGSGRLALLGPEAHAARLLDELRAQRREPDTGDGYRPPLA